MSYNIEDLIRKYLNPVLGSPKFFGKQLKYNCPQPGCDRGNKFNLELCLNENLEQYLHFNCWSCHYHGWIRKLLTDFAENDSWKRYPEFKSGDFVGVRVPKEKAIIELPTSIPYYHSDVVSKYLLEERKMRPEFCDKRNIRYVSTKDHELYNNIVFPFYDNGILTSFSTQNFETKRYKNHGSLNFVKYREFLNTDFPITITEGVYDAGSVPNSIPLLGTKVYKNVLRFCANKLIILALDDEVKEEEKNQIALELISYRAKVVILDMNGHKDLNAYYIAEEKELKENLLNVYKLLLYGKK